MHTDYDNTLTISSCKDVNNDQEKVQHKHVLQLFVKDVSLYKDNTAFEKAKADMYEWIEGDYEKVIGQALEKKDNSENCPHFAE